MWEQGFKFSGLRSISSIIGRFVMFQKSLSSLWIVTSIKFAVLIFLTSGCTYEASQKKVNDTSDTGGTNPSSFPECADDQANTASCQITSIGKMITSTLGGDVTSWLNVSAGTTVTASIPNGYYLNKQVSFTETDLLAANIVSGVDIFGVTGTAAGPYGACSEDSGTVNASACSTSASRYVYSSLYGGRSANCSAGGNASACWTNASNQYMTSTAGSAVSGSDGSLTATIPLGYYDSSQSCSMIDSDL